MKITPEYVFFFSGKDEFSNFYPIDFVHEGIEFSSSEQAVMYHKAMLFGSNEIALKILDTTTPGQAKNLGRSCDIPFSEKLWKEHRERIYYEVLISKFNQPELNKLLIGTKKRILVETSPYDKIWGIGLSQDSPLIYYPNLWPGKNLLGKALMDVREYYRQIK